MPAFISAPTPTNGLIGGSSADLRRLKKAASSSTPGPLPSTKPQALPRSAPRRRTLEEALEEVYRMHPKDRQRVDAMLRLGTISAAAKELGEDRDTISASWKRHRSVLADIVGSSVA